jgi:5'(3')-deoxyribonucleotidase
MKIGIDLDSVLNALEAPWEKWIQEHIDPKFGIEQWTTWGIQDLLGEKVFDYLEIPGTFRNLPVRSGAQNAVQQLLDAGHDIYVITACLESSPAMGGIIQDKLEWLQEHFPQICPTRIVFTSQKHLVNVDLLIDDGPHNIEAFPNQTIVFDAPWNKTLTAYKRAHTWEEVMEHILGKETKSPKDERKGGCPCLHTTPCAASCTCANPFMSGGCGRCAKYGSIEQQTAAAVHIATALKSSKMPTVNDQRLMQSIIVGIVTAVIAIIYLVYAIATSTHPFTLVP